MLFALVAQKLVAQETGNNLVRPTVSEVGNGRDEGHGHKLVIFHALFDRFQRTAGGLGQFFTGNDFGADDFLTDCLGIALLNVQESNSLAEALAYGLGGGLGFSLVIALFACLRERTEGADPGLPEHASSRRGGGTGCLGERYRRNLRTPLVRRR